MYSITHSIYQVDHLGHVNCSMCRLPSFYWALYYCASRIFCVFYKLKVFGNPLPSKSISPNFSNSIYSLHIFIILTIFQISSLWWWSVVFNVTLEIILWCPYKMKKLINAVYVLTVPPTSCSPSLTFSLGLPIPWSTAI